MSQSVSGSSLHHRGVLCSIALFACVVASGCTILGDVVGYSEQVKEAQAQVRISGVVETEGDSDGTLVIVLGRVVEGEEDPVGVDAFTRENPGSFLFIVSPGAYQLGAYEDRNLNGMVDPDERVSRVKTSPIYTLAPGDAVKVDLMLKNGSEFGDEMKEPFDVLALVERTPKEQREFSLWAFSQRGTVCDDFDDARFGEKAGPLGLWKPMDFLNEELAGIYFLEPYDPKRIPVLFVHGISGYPQQFSTLIDELDTTRFQPWFYFYPSGASLSGISGHLAAILLEVQIKTGFDEIAVVAHSMGGLVSRGALFKYASETEREDVRLFISISTPWGGDVKAKSTEGAPIQLPESFSDMNPSSEYLRWVFFEDEDQKQPKRLPEEIDYHMIFGFGGKGGECNDGSVSCASEARSEVQEEALTVRAWNYGHVEILHSDQTVARVNGLLSARFR